MSSQAIDLTKEKAPRLKQLIAIASGKGGVGKTLLTVNLALALASRKKTTLLFDGDLGLANVDIQLGLNPKKDLGSFISGHNTLRQITQTIKSYNFDIISGRSGSGELSSLPSSQINHLRHEVGAISHRYNFVLMDLAAGVEQSIRQLSVQAGTYLIVTTPDPTAITDAYASIKFMLKEDPESDFEIVVNMAKTFNEGKVTYEALSRACHKFLNFTPRLAGIIRLDRRAVSSVRKQKPVLDLYPNSDVSKDIQKLANHLIESHG